MKEVGCSILDLFDIIEQDTFRGTKNKCKYNETFTKSLGSLKYQANLILFMINYL